MGTGKGDSAWIRKLPFALNFSFYSQHRCGVFERCLVSVLDRGFHTSLHMVQEPTFVCWRLALLLSSNAQKL